MTTFSRRGLHGQIVNQLGLRIIRGEIKSGETIDPDALLHEFEVSRTVMREAIKVLTAKGLLDARPRLGTYVTQRSRWQLLDGDVMTWRSQDDPDPLLVLELDEVRQAIEPAAAAMAALRGTDLQLEAIESALVVLESTSHTDEHLAADLAFHRAILAASGNELLEQFEVVLEPALHARDVLAYAHAKDRAFVDKHRRVFEAIASRSAESARSAMRELIDSAAKDTESILFADPKNADLRANRVRTR